MNIRNKKQTKNERTIAEALMSTRRGLLALLFLSLSLTSANVRLLIRREGGKKIRGLLKRKKRRCEIKLFQGPRNRLLFFEYTIVTLYRSRYTYISFAIQIYSRHFIIFYYRNNNKQNEDKSDIKSIEQFRDNN